MAKTSTKTATPKKVAAKEKVTKEVTKDANGLDWDAAEKKLITAESRKGKDGHYHNTVVAPLREQFNAGGLNPQLHEAMMKL